LLCNIDYFGSLLQLSNYLHKVNVEVDRWLFVSL